MNRPPRYFERRARADFVRLFAHGAEAQDLWRRFFDTKLHLSLRPVQPVERRAGGGIVGDYQIGIQERRLVCQREPHGVCAKASAAFQLETRG
jgi:hypothetical protein